MPDYTVIEASTLKRLIIGIIARLTLGVRIANELVTVQRYGHENGFEPFSYEKKGRWINYAER